MKKISKEYLEIINKGELSTTELKTATNKLPKSLFESICAFLIVEAAIYF